MAAPAPAAAAATAPPEPFSVPGEPDRTAYTIDFAQENGKDDPHMIRLKPGWGDGDGQSLLIRGQREHEADCGLLQHHDGPRRTRT